MLLKHRPPTATMTTLSSDCVSAMEKYRLLVEHPQNKIGNLLETKLSIDSVFALFLLFSALSLDEQ